MKMATMVNSELPDYILNGPPKKPVYDVFDKEGIKKVTKLYVNFSALNEHRFPHNFECNSPTCMCGRGIEDLIPMEEEIDNWVNHDFWYTNQCIDHYDTDIPLANITGDEPQSMAKTTTVESYCPPQPISNSNIDSNVFFGNGQNPQYSSVPALKVEVESPVTSIYMVQNEPTTLIPSPTIPLQSTTSDSGVTTESFVTGSTSSSPVSCATPSEADSIYIQEGHMITFLKSDKGLEMFAKAHNITKRDLINYLDSKKNGDDIYHHQNPSPGDHGEKHDEDIQKRRRHRGTYSKSTCLKVIQFVKKGYSARAAAKKFGIPKSTVHNWLHEDVSTRPEKGHRKKDLHTERNDECDHEYNRNMNDLGHSLAQTTIKDEPRHNFQGDRLMVDQNSFSGINTCPTASQSALVQLLTTNRQLSPFRKDDQQNHVGFNQSEIDNVDFGVIDDILQPDDWIGHEQWYKDQYHNHYNKDYSNGKLRKSYGTYSNEHRKKATDFVKSGRTLSAASKEFNIPKSTIHTWLNEGNVPCELPPELESCVVEEIEHSKDGNSSPSLAVIKKKAEEVAVPHMEKFRPSFAWCRDFMKRHYMDRDEEIDSKKLCFEDFKQKETVNNLVSTLGLSVSRQDPV